MWPQPFSMPEWQHPQQDAYSERLEGNGCVLVVNEVSGPEGC
jgi:hypothetical protein